MSVEELDSHTGHAPRDLGGEPAHVVALDDPAWGGTADEDPPVRPLSQALAAGWARIPARRVVTAVVAGALVAGLLIGTATTDGRRDRQAAAVRDSEVLIAAVPGRTSDLLDVRDAGLVGMTGSFELLNMGRAAVTVMGIRAETRGFTASAVPGELTITPGGSRVVLLRGEADCATFVGAEPARIVARVRTADGVERTTPVTATQSANGVGIFDPGVCTANANVSLSSRYEGMTGPDEDGSVAFAFRLTYDDPTAKALDVTSVSLGWADSARVDTGGGSVRIPVIGGILRVRVDVDACPIVDGQALDGGLSLQTRSADGSRTGDAYISAGAVYQADVLGFLADICGPELAGRAPGPS